MQKLNCRRSKRCSIDHSLFERENSNESWPEIVLEKYLVTSDRLVHVKESLNCLAATRKSRTSRKLFTYRITEKLRDLALPTDLNDSTEFHNDSKIKQLKPIRGCLKWDSRTIIHGCIREAISVRERLKLLESKVGATKRRKSKWVR